MYTTHKGAGGMTKDSKRQNFDLASAEAYLPVLLLFLTQMDLGVTYRYRNAWLLILYETITGSPTDSAYKFCRKVLNYDLADFF